VNWVKVGKRCINTDGVSIAEYSKDQTVVTLFVDGEKITISTEDAERLFGLSKAEEITERKRPPGKFQSFG
jgi:hypothetical protein